jgi:hypothetical protein
MRCRVKFWLSKIQDAGVTTVNVIYAGTNSDGSENFYGNRLYLALVGGNSSGGTAYTNQLTLMESLKWELL